MQRHDASNERGIALVLALFLMSALSVLGASLMFLSQTETYASLNYRMMSQARYAGEAGINKAANFLLDTAQYPVPTATGGTDPLTAYNTTVSPVQFNGLPVILTSGTWTGVTANYPVASVRTDFNTAGQGTLAAGNITLSYKTYATLISMQTFDAYGGTQNVIQTWEITSSGGLSGNTKANVEVVGTIETPKVTANSYAAFATSNSCDAIYFHGNVTVDSYDSSDPLGYAHSHADSDGDVGTNGNLHISGSVDVQGNLYTPRTGVGGCTAGAVTGLTEGGSATVEGSMVQLPTEVTFPLPQFTVTPPTTTVTLTTALLGSTPVTAAAACTALGLVYGTPTTTPQGNCDLRSTAATSNPLLPSATQGGAGPYTNLIVGDGGTGTLWTNLTLPSVVVNSGVTLTLKGHGTPGQVIDVNSIGGSGDVTIDNTVGTNSSVILKVSGKNLDGTDMATPFDLANLNGWKQNGASGSTDASGLQIVYGGTATISMKGGNSQSAATIYAPNAAFQLQGTQDLYGSVLAKTITNGGNASIHYDRRLQRDFHVAGHPMMGTFSWKRGQ